MTTPGPGWGKLARMANEQPQSARVTGVPFTGATTAAEVSAAWLQPAAHPVYGRLLCAELKRRGFSERQILEGTRVDWATLHSDNRFISFEQMRRVVTHALSLSGCPWLGIDVGLQTQVAAHGALGQAAAASPSIAHMVDLLRRYIPLRQRILALRIDVREGPDGGVGIAAHETFIDPAIREYVLCHVTAGLIRLLETVTGLSLHNDIEIEWPFAEPLWSAEYQRLAARNRFGCPNLRAQLSPTLLGSPSLAADPEALRLAERECERQLRRDEFGGSLTRRVQHRLTTADGHFPSLREFAAEEHMSERTLIRRLHDEGTTWQALLDDVRQELACWLLLQTDLSVEAIAERLGYADPSNFSRTFRRWLDMTPREFRERR
jgi:AraC-like DNA-binding protein